MTCMSMASWYTVFFTEQLPTPDVEEHALAPLGSMSSMFSPTTNAI